MTIRITQRVLTGATRLICALFITLSTATVANAETPMKTDAAVHKVYAIATIQLRAGKYREFLKLMADEEVNLGKADGVRLLASYTIQHGQGGEVVDIWEAPDYNTLAKVFFANPEGLTAELGSSIASFSIKTAFLNPLKYRE
jgi:hypothetical protein